MTNEQIEQSVAENLPEFKKAVDENNGEIVLLMVDAFAKSESQLFWQAAWYARINGVTLQLVPKKQ